MARMIATLLLAALLVAAIFAGGVAAAAADELDAADPDARALALPGRRLTQESAIRTMSGKQLRRFLSDRGAGCDGCIEKEHLVERALDVRAWATADELVATHLAPSSASAATHLGLHHIAVPPADMPAGTVAFVGEPTAPETQRHLDGGDVVINNEVVCNQPLVNGTQYCHSIAGMQKHARAAME